MRFLAKVTSPVEASNKVPKAGRLGKTVQLIFSTWWLAGLAGASILTGNALAFTVPSPSLNAATSPQIEKSWYDKYGRWYHRSPSRGGCWRVDRYGRRYHTC